MAQSGAILGRKFQPHESHVPYLLQVKVDFNLYGMGFMRLSKVLFRYGHAALSWACVVCETSGPLTRHAPGLHLPKEGELEQAACRGPTLKHALGLCAAGTRCRRASRTTGLAGRSSTGWSKWSWAVSVTERFMLRHAGQATDAVHAAAAAL